MAARGKRGKTNGRWQRWLKRAVLALLILAAIPLVLVPVYAVVAPPVTTLMLWRAVEGYGMDRDWVPFEAMGERLPLSVMASEDSRFCEHNGVDWDAVAEALDEDRDGGPRGASTISMQTVKNLFLWPSRSYVRKGLEVPLALYADLVWPKRRMLEIYLNSVEFGPGIYGAGAAARVHFGKAPAELSSREAALLAAVLPNPLGRDAGKPGRGTLRIARVIERRVPAQRGHAGCVGLE